MRPSPQYRAPPPDVGPAKSLRVEVDRITHAAARVTQLAETAEVLE
ncbi:hypothetical protein [Kribbella sp. NBC_00889]|jgi:hypothetical protein|nr:hypothetical protein OG817_24465 [Kribbella sp. NBC_00889]